MRGKVIKNKNKNGGIRQQGFVLLVAVVVASILLSIGIGIANFTYRELILSSTSRNSTYSFYAADTGTECAYYWDNILDNITRAPSAFAPVPPGDPDDPNDSDRPARPDILSCNAQDIDLTSCQPPNEENDYNTNCRSDDTGTTVFGFSLAQDLRNVKVSPYARVFVDKHITDQSVTEARGVNINNPNNTHRVERAIRTTY